MVVGETVVGDVEVGDIEVGDDVGTVVGAVVIGRSDANQMSMPSKPQPLPHVAPPSATVRGNRQSATPRSSVWEAHLARAVE